MVGFSFFIYQYFKGSGLALWNKNIDGLSEHYDIYCFDLLGFGRSSRPAFKGQTPEGKIIFNI
jgi:pimeloyl-ACP methyl ester carboxylesterase